MALFPAYGDKTSTEGSSFQPPIPQSEVDLENEISIEDNTIDDIRDSYDEAEFLKSDNSEVISDSKKDGTTDTKKRKKNVKRSKSKKKSKTDSDKYKFHTTIDSNADYYVDCKIDYGNLRVSTLYKPARPHYNYTSKILGQFFSSRRRKLMDSKRYYNMKIVPYIHDSEQKPARPSKSKSKKVMEDYIEITDSGIPWDDIGIEEDLIDKTAHFNKYLNNNPYDVDMWLQYVKLQEDRMAFDICNDRVTSQATARNLCYTKQLSILDTALKNNYNSMDLLSKKVQLSEQSMPNDQYMAMLKQLISTPELQKSLLTRAWFWYIDSVQCSMALSSVPSVKEMYAAAIKALNKAQAQTYQNSHVDITYRLGLFLRQAGLWEQLWALLRMNMEMNLAASHTDSISSFENLVTKFDESSVIAEENLVINSGLPLHTIWGRIESLRSSRQWLPSDEEADDPQRIVFSTDLTDFIKPVTQKTNMFKLIINIFRLLKIPLLPMRHTMSSVLTPNEPNLDWEYDCTEINLVFVYSIINNINKIDNGQLKVIAMIMKDFVEEPNYLNASGEYFAFVSNVMVQCAKWLDGDEKTALLIWWMRFQRSLVAAINPAAVSGQKSPASLIRKSVKDMLKSHRDDVILYGEFSFLEAQLCGSSRGHGVLDTSLRTIACDKSNSRIYLVRSYVEMLLQDACYSNENIVKSINVLISLAMCLPLPKDLLQDCGSEVIDEALQMFADYTDTLLLAISNFDREMLLVEHLLPDATVNWICCHGWLIYLTQPYRAIQQFYTKLTVATSVKKDEMKMLDSKRYLWIRENILEWFVTIVQSHIRISTETETDMCEQVLSLAIEEFPSNSFLVWRCVNAWSMGGPIGRWRLVNLLKKTDNPSHLLALGFTLHDFIHLYRRDDPDYEDFWQPGHSNRLLSLLQTVCGQPGLTRCALLWRMLLTFVTDHGQVHLESSKKVLYQALDECPWNKGLYRAGCIHVPSDFAELVDLMVEKQIRLHAMPEELQPL